MVVVEAPVQEAVTPAERPKLTVKNRKVSGDVVVVEEEAPKGNGTGRTETDTGEVQLAGVTNVARESDEVQFGDSCVIQRFRY